MEALFNRGTEESVVGISKELWSQCPTHGIYLRATLTIHCLQNNYNHHAYNTTRNDVAKLFLVHCACGSFVTVPTQITLVLNQSQTVSTYRVCGEHRLVSSCLCSVPRTPTASEGALVLWMPTPIVHVV